MSNVFTEPVLSACVVLYHSNPKQVSRLVQCFQDSDLQLELYIVDNAPGGDTCPRLLWQCPGIHYYPQKKNLGYGKANNLVIPMLRSRYHLICNPDVSFDNHLLSRMVEYMNQNRECAILTPRVFNADGTEQFLPKRAPRVRYMLSGKLERLPGPFRSWRAEYTLRNEQIAVPTNVEFATGCFMLIRTGYLRQLGGFDPAYFLYHEDSDLSLQALKLGNIVYHPEMTITHNWTHLSGHSLKGVAHHLRSTLHFFHKWGWRW